METQPICPSCRKTLPPGTPLGLCPECLIKSGFNTGTDPGQAGKGSGFVPPPVEEIRRLFPQLEIIELIGQGGMGAVYKARQPTLDRFVALKILPPGAAGDAGFAERFNREARALARLNHPQIVAVHDFGQTGGQPYLIMEFVDGANLRQVEQAGRLAPEQALQIVPQICEALQFAHNEGIVHRDIKPENILIDKKGRVKITDFGIAKILGVSSGKASLTGAKDVVGTPHYMAPEQVEHPQTVDHRADIYSLGVVFYEMLTGELPLGKFAPPSKKVHMDVRLDEVVLRTLEKEPELRYQQASEVKTQVETIATTPPGSSPAQRDQSSQTEAQSQLTSVATTPPRFSRTAIVGAVWAVLFFVGAALLAALLIEHPMPSRPPADGGAGVQRVISARFLLLLSPLWLLALAAPFGTTILGWTAVAQIRRSAGRLYGLGLAVFDGLLFPLLALDGLLGLVCSFSVHLFGELLPNGWKLAHSVTFNNLSWTTFIVLSSLSVAVVDFLIIRWVWRKVNRPLDGRPASVAASGSAALQKTVSGWRVGWIIVTVACGLALFWFAITRMTQTNFRHARSKAVQTDATRSLYPKAAHISTNHLSVLIYHDDVDLHYALFHADTFSTSIANSSMGGKSWLDQGGVTLVNQRTFGFRRESSNPERLYVNGREFYLGAGRVFVLQDDGKVEQQFLFPPLEVAQDVEALPQLIREQRRSTVNVFDMSTVTFGPVIERVVNDSHAEEGNNCLDLDSGQVFTLPESRKADFVWMLKNGIDVICALDGTASQGAAATGGSVAQQIPNERWETIPASEVISAVMQKKPDFGGSICLVDQAAAVGKPSLPVTFFFHTREGAMGVLQVLTHTDNPRGVRIRYKLVENAEAKPSTASLAALPAQTLSFSPVIERVQTNDCAMDLDTGKQAELLEFKTAKEGLDGITEKVAAIATWMEQQGMDALFADDFTAYGMKVKLLREEDWSKMSLSQLGEAIRTIDPKSPPQVLLNPGLAPYAFQTREGGQGILQVLDNENPHGVKIRYKLVQGANAPSRSETGDTPSAPKPVTPTTTPGNTTAQTKLEAIKPLWDDAYVALMEKNDPTGAGARLNQALPAMDKLQSSLHGTEAARPIAVGIDQVRLVLEALNQGKVEQARTLMKSLNVSGPMFEGLVTNSDALHQQPVLHEAGELQSPGEPGVNGTETPVPQAPQPVQRLSKGEYGQDFRMTFPLTPQGRFRLDNPNGTIEITGWDQNEVLVKGVKRGKKREAVEATKIDVDSGVDRVAVHTRVPRKLMGWGNGNVTVDYTIHVPRTARLEKIENANGNVVIEGVIGDIEASTANGSVRAKGSTGNLKLSTANGAVTAEPASLSGSQSVSLEAANGSITATLPPDANAAVVADTSNGSITSEFSSLTVKKDGPNGSHLAGTLGKGGTSIKAQIANGKITIRRGL